MTFLNIALLGGLAAATVPLIIHLLSRRRYREVRWGAMHLLENALQSRRRSIQIEQLLLLLVRCLIVCLIALFMARPVLTGMQALIGNSETSTLVLLDNSYSMQAGGAESGTDAQARAAVDSILNDMGRGSEAGVLLMAGGARTLTQGLTFNLGALRRELAERPATQGRAEIPEAFEEAASLVSRMRHSQREILVVSDFQKVSWGEEEAEARRAALTVLKDQPLPPNITFMSMGRESLDNVSVQSLGFSRLIYGVGQAMQLRATIKNHGERSYSGLRVYFKADGRERSASQINLGPGEQRQVLFRHTFETPGSHVVEVLAEADALEVDNAFQASVPVWDRLPVLLIDGAPSTEPLRGETDFLRIALNPYSRAKSELSDLLETIQTTPNDFDPNKAPEVRVVILANVDQLKDHQVQWLVRFVKDGGGLLIFPGDQASPAWYNDVLGKRHGLLPLPLTDLAGKGPEADEGARIVSDRFTHPSLALFNDPSQGNLSEGILHHWYRLGSGALPEDVVIPAMLDSGDPFLAEKTVGGGRVMICAIPADADWSNLPVRPVYLPLMQRLATYLGSTVFPPRNVEPGRPLAALLPATEAGQTLQVIRPDGRQVPLQVESREARALAEYRDTDQSGLYQFVLPNQEILHFVVQPDRTESELALLNEAEREALARSLDVGLVDGVQAWRNLEQRRRFGQEIWQPIFWMLLVLLFLELALQQWIQRRQSQ